MAAAAVSAWRGGRWLPSLAAATATLLVVDAWFDVITSPGTDLIEALAYAGLVELPMAGVCIWLTTHAQRIVELRHRFRCLSVQLLLGHVLQGRPLGGDRSPSARLRHTGLATDSAEGSQISTPREVC